MGAESLLLSHLNKYFLMFFKRYSGSSILFTIHFLIGVTEFNAAGWSDRMDTLEPVRERLAAEDAVKSPRARDHDEIPTSCHDGRLKFLVSINPKNLCLMGRHRTDFPND